MASYLRKFVDEAQFHKQDKFVLIGAQYDILNSALEAIASDPESTLEDEQSLMVMRDSLINTVLGIRCESVEDFANKFKFFKTLYFDERSENELSLEEQLLKTLYDDSLILA